MKIRTDFVTNSSSSSFILAYKSKEDALASVAQDLAYDPEALSVVIRDIAEAAPLTPEALAEIIEDEADSHAYWIIHFGEGSWWSSNKDTWEKRWMDTHRGKNASDMRASAEYKAEKERIKKEFKEKIKAKIADNAYILELSYSDNDGELFSHLEHEAMHSIKGMVQSFSHH